MLRNRLPLDGVVCERRRLNQDIVDFASYYGLQMTIIEHMGELAVSKRRRNLGVSCGFGLIFKREAIELFECGIWNIHYGSLPQYRGRHPVSWALLRGDERIGLTVHAIDEQIDRGYKLAEGFVTRDMKDGQEEIELKLEKALNDHVLDAAIDAYHTGHRVPVEEGVYYESLVGRLDSINPEEYDSRSLFDLFASQRCYGGVRVGGYAYNRCNYWHPSISYSAKASLRVRCKDGVWMVLVSEDN